MIVFFAGIFCGVVLVVAASIVGQFLADVANNDRD